MPFPQKAKDSSGMNYRAVAMKKATDGKPGTLDESSRSVEIVAATEQPVPVLDWERWEMVNEVLLMSGCQIPANGQAPMLDSHARYNTATVIGSVRELRVDGDLLLGRAVYSRAPEAEGPYLKMTEGHLTDYSVGYRYDKADSIYVPDGETASIDGRLFTGPVKVVRKWQVKEVSACPIGADDLAKARAATPPAFNPKESQMNERLRKYLESRGLPVGATEEEAFRYLESLDLNPAAPAAAAAPASGTRSEDEIRIEAARAEQSRISDIRAICRHANMDEATVDGHIRSNATVEAVRKAAFEAMIAAPPTTPGARGSIETGADERDKFRAAGEHALLLRAGIAVAQPAPGAHDLRGFTLREMARESLRVAGMSISGNPLEMIGRALTTSDFPTLLGNTARLSLMSGWETAGETWQLWCGVGEVTDFKIHTMARAGELDDLDQINEEGEYKYGKRSEQKEQYNIATYGKLSAISRQAIINDELGAITDAFASHGEAAARKIGDLPYAVLTANAAMGDGTALFHSNHGNLLTGAALDVTSLGAAELAMGLQKDIGGRRRLNIRPQFFIAPLTMKTTSEQFFRTDLIGTQAQPNVQNIFSGAYFTRVYDPRLDDNDTNAWYLAGAKGKTVTVFFLNGNQAPYLETRNGWTIDGVEFKVRIDAGAKAVDWKGLCKNPGPT